ncbi:MAG: ATP-binding protein [Planctomycetes bacterium]|nr:ATP-binding protein [Planctomycetota bacterium]
MRRLLFDPVVEDLRRKMVFVSGPRQVGKTTLARQILEALAPTEPVYLNWDRAEHRRVIRDLGWSRRAPVAVLDEVHKYPRWKTLVKGFHDTEGAVQRLLITGSARLDHVRRGGDSLAGRYTRFRLHPLTAGEIARGGRAPETGSLLDPARWSRGGPAVPADSLDALLALGGFPEPFLGGSDRQARRWRLNRREQVLRDDLRDLTLIREVALVEQLVDLLPARVGSPLSLNALREDLEVDYKTVARWMEALERLFVVFRVHPYGGSLARTLRKESKLYFLDWSEVPDPGARFENCVAGHLLKLVHWLQDAEGIAADLRYVRDREKREVDFLLLKDRRPWVLVEAKLGETRPSPALGYFRDRLNVPHAVQVVARGAEGREVVPAARWLAALV